MVIFLTLRRLLATWKNTWDKIVPNEVDRVLDSFEQRYAAPPRYHWQFSAVLESHILARDIEQVFARSVAPIIKQVGRKVMIQQSIQSGLNSISHIRKVASCCVPSDTRNTLEVVYQACEDVAVDLESAESAGSCVDSELLELFLCYQRTFNTLLIVVAAF